MLKKMESEPLLYNSTWIQNVYAHGAVKKKRNCPFKGTTQQYGKCISMAKHPLTPTWRLRQAALFEVHQWISQAWIAYYIRFDIQELQSDENFKCMVLTGGICTKTLAIGTVYVAQNGSPEF
jgi:hypothetical protein